MKSREGTVVDADDLMEEMIATAKETSQELGKLDGLTQEGADDIASIVGLGALKYFILKVDARKNMTFNIPMHVYNLYFVRRQRTVSLFLSNFL